MLGKAEWTVRKNKNKVISMCFTMHSAPIISRNVNDTVSILYILYWYPKWFIFFLSNYDGCSSSRSGSGPSYDVELGCTGIFEVPGVGFNDVVIETPFHNMCAALEQEECLGSCHSFGGGRLHAPNFSSKCLGLCTMCSPRCIGLTLRAIVIRGRELLANPLVGYVTVPRRWFQSRSSVCYGSYEKLRWWWWWCWWFMIYDIMI